MIGIVEPPATAEHPPADSASANLVLSQLWAFDEDHVLGTRLRVLVNAPIEALARRAAVAAKREIERLDAVFNWRRSDSELTELNKNRIGVASAELFAVVQLAETWRRITLGAFDGRLGELLQLWSHKDSPAPNSIHAARHRLREPSVLLRPVRREIELSPLASLSLDAIAKGYIVDAALNAARREVPSINGIAVNIGGDIRCWGEAPPKTAGDCGWRVGISDPINSADNAPIVDVVWLRNAAIATSGRGPRDCVQGRYRSTTISPFTGRPVNAVISASVVASHAADADAIATACLVLPPRESLALVERLDGVAARITDAKGRVHESSGWRKIQVAAATPKKSAAKSTQSDSKTQPDKESLPADRRWPADWEIGVSYVAPDKNESDRSADFRTPYMVLWISDEENHPVYTLTMVGQDPKWQKDNYIWWTTHAERSVPLVELRSQATALSGRYRLFWGGLDEQWRPLPIGNYVLHIETSQERGKHTHRSLTLEIGRERFKKSLPNLPESGGLEITYGHYNDRFKDE